MRTASRYTHSMTATTIKVSAELRDRLKTQAATHHRTLGEHLEVLLEEELRRERFRQQRAAMLATPLDDEYTREARDWQSDAWS